MPGLFHRFPQNVITIFSGRNLLWHLLAVVLTMIIVLSGFDWSYYLLTRGDEIFHIARPAIVLGSVLPVFGLLLFLIGAEISRKPRIITTAWALGQSAILGFLISSGCKAFTGRLPPPSARRFRMTALTDTPLTDTSHGFQFGFLKGGMFWGWPSSHTTVAFAMSACLITLYPKNKALVLGALTYAFYVGLGVSVSIHWFSEFVAGAIVGGVIGKVVGKSFKPWPV